MTIDLYTWSTPNGRKASIALEELDLAYKVHPINITKDEQFQPAFLAVSPNNKIPAIVDPEGPDGRPLALFESGAILIYLAEKTGRLLPGTPVARTRALEWLMWQMGGFGPMLGQAHHFNAYAPMNPSGPVVLPYAQARYTNEAGRLYGVLDRQLASHQYVAANEYSIADMAIFPWCRLYKRQGQDIDDFPNVKRWFAMIARRPAVERDMGMNDTNA